jgi:hypothetical protein
MKYKYFLFLCLIFLVFLISCRQENDIKEQMEEKTTICFTATAEKDSAWLKIDTSSMQIIGLLNFNYPNEKRRYEGQFKGQLYGDTLKGHFDFRVNKVDKWYRNPVAFLKRDGKLIMGIGKFSMVWGSPFFDAQLPINYDKGRFIFEMVGCD